MWVTRKDFTIREHGCLIHNSLRVISLFVVVFFNLSRTTFLLSIVLLLSHSQMVLFLTALISLCVKFLKGLKLKSFVQHGEKLNWHYHKFYF